MKHGSFLVNMARGGVVDETALLRRAHRRRTAAAERRSTCTSRGRGRRSPPWRTCPTSSSRPHIGAMALGLPATHRRARRGTAPRPRARLPRRAPHPRRGGDRVRRLTRPAARTCRQSTDTREGRDDRNEPSGEEAGRAAGRTRGREALRRGRRARRDERAAHRGVRLRRRVGERLRRRHDDPRPARPEPDDDDRDAGRRGPHRRRDRPAGRSPTATTASAACRTSSARSSSTSAPASPASASRTTCSRSGTASTPGESKRELIPVEEQARRHPGRQGGAGDRLLRARRPRRGAHRRARRRGGLRARRRLRRGRRRRHPDPLARTSRCSEIEGFLDSWGGLGKTPLVAVPTLFPDFTDAGALRQGIPDGHPGQPPDAGGRAGHGADAGHAAHGAQGRRGRSAHRAGRPHLRPGRTRRRPSRSRSPAVERPLAAAVDGPSLPAAVVSVSTRITGLQTARILAARGVPVIGMTNDLGHYACRTRACGRVVQADLRSEQFVDALVDSGPQLDDRAALFPCTDLDRPADLAAPGAARPVVPLRAARPRRRRDAHGQGRLPAARAGGAACPIPGNGDPRRPGRRRARGPRR